LLFWVAQVLAFVNPLHLAASFLPKFFDRFNSVAPRPRCANDHLATKFRKASKSSIQIIGIVTSAFHAYLEVVHGHDGGYVSSSRGTPDIGFGFWVSDQQHFKGCFDSAGFSPVVRTVNGCQLFHDPFLSAKPALPLALALPFC